MCMVPNIGLFNLAMFLGYPHMQSGDKLSMPWKKGYIWTVQNLLDIADTHLIILHTRLSTTATEFNKCMNILFSHYIALLLIVLTCLANIQ